MLLLGFWGWLFFRRMFPAGDRPTPDYWQTKSRTDARWWRLWVLVAVGWLTAGFILYGWFSPSGLIVPAVPAVVLLGSLFG